MVLQLCNVVIVSRTCFRNILCGTLQCYGGSQKPIVQGLSDQIARTIISIGGDEFECKYVTRDI